MNSAYYFNGKSNVLKSVFAVGALALSLAGAKAQVVTSPYGVQIGGMSGGVFTSPYMGYGYNALGGNPYGIQGYINPYGISSYSPLGGVVYPQGNIGIPLANRSIAVPTPNVSNAIPIGGGVEYMNPNYGGVTVTQGNGYDYMGPQGNYNPYVDVSASNNPLYNQSYQQAQYNNYLNDRRADALAQSQMPLTLAQSILVQRQRNFGLTFVWRGDPRQLLSMKVTLLNSLHLPVSSAFGEYGKPAVFEPNPYTYAARYYRVDVQYTDGTQDSTMGTVRATR